MTKILILLAVISFAIAPSFADVADSANIRLVNLVPDAPMLDIYINGQISSIEPLAYSDMSAWVQVPAGHYEIAFVPAGGAYEDALMSAITLDAEAETWLTLAATGSIATASLETQLISEDMDTALFVNTARLTIFFGIEGVSAVNILANEGIIVTGMHVNEDADIVGIASIDMPIGFYSLQFVNAAESHRLLTSFEIELQANTSTLVMVTGRQESPQVLVEVTQMGEIATTSPQEHKP